MNLLTRSVAVKIVVRARIENGRFKDKYTAGIKSSKAKIHMTQSEKGNLPQKELQSEMQSIDYNNNPSTPLKDSEELRE